MNLYVYIHTCKCFISCNIFSNFVIQCHLVFVNKNNNTVLRNACFWLVNKHKGFCVFVGLKWENDWLLKWDGDYWNGWDTFWYHCKIVWHERHITDEGERTFSQIVMWKVQEAVPAFCGGSRGLHCSQEWRVNTPVGSTRGASAVKGQHSCGGCWVCNDSPGLAPLWGQKRVAMAVRGQHKLQALVYDILSSTTAVFSYAIGSRKLSANEQVFFVGGQTVMSLLQTTEIKQGVSFLAANKVYTSTNKTTIVWIEMELFFNFFTQGGCVSCLRACFGARLLLQSY